MRNLTVFSGTVPGTRIPLASRTGVVYIQGVLETAFPDSANKGDFELTHRFAGGVYARELKIKAGNVLVGRLHKFEHLVTISAGRVSVLSAEGVREFTAPVTFVSSPGDKRVIYAHEDTVWTTYHRTNLTDPDAIEREVTCESYMDYDVYVESLEAV